LNRRVELEPIVYERVELPGQSRPMWRVPDEERADWERRPLKAKRPPRGPLDTEARPLPELLGELEPWLYLSARLRRRFESFYRREPVRATRLATRTIAGAKDGSLHSPDGFLASSLVQED
jgi:hypothetical protein